MNHINLVRWFPIIMAFSLIVGGTASLMANSQRSDNSFAIKVTAHEAGRIRRELCLSLGGRMLGLIVDGNVVLKQELPEERALSLFDRYKGEFASWKQAAGPVESLEIALSSRIGDVERFALVSIKKGKHTIELESVYAFMKQVEQDAELQDGEIVKKAASILRNEPTSQP